MVTIDTRNAHDIGRAIRVALHDRSEPPIILLDVGGNKQVDSMRRAVQDGVRMLVRNCKIVWELRLSVCLTVKTGQSPKSILGDVLSRNNDEFGHGREVLDVALDHLLGLEKVVAGDNLPRVVGLARILAGPGLANDLVLRAEIAESSGPREFAAIDVTHNSLPVVATIFGQRSFRVAIVTSACAFSADP